MSVVRAIIPRTAPPEEALREALRALDRGAAAALATVVGRSGSAPSTPGQKLAVWREGEELCAVGTVGGGAIERAVTVAMWEALDAGAAAPAVHTFRLGAELGMCCGGAAEVLVEVLRPARAVLLVGAGHVGLATARLLPELGFRAVLVDARREAVGEGRVAAASALGVIVVEADHDDPEVLEQLACDPRGAALVVMTHDHQLDQRVVEWALGRGFSFVGGVGSRAKAARTQKRLEAKGVAPEDVARVRMPVGTAIGARTPAEIAVAICGDLVAWRSGLGGARQRARAPADQARATKEREDAAS